MAIDAAINAGPPCQHSADETGAHAVAGKRSAGRRNSDDPRRTARSVTKTVKAAADSSWPEQAMTAHAAHLTVEAGAPSVGMTFSHYAAASCTAAGNVAYAHLA